MGNYYKILGIDEEASKEEIKKAYRKLAHKHHPDKGGDEKEFKKISEAYTLLSKDENRKKYDEEMGKKTYEEDARGETSIFSCWFCGEHLESTEQSIKEAMHYVTDRRYERIYYQSFELIIPRCARCAHLHKVNAIGCISAGGAIGLLVSLLVGDYFFWIFMGFVIGYWQRGLVGNETTKAKNYKKQFPIYKEMISKGWRIGASPPTS